MLSLMQRLFLEYMTYLIISMKTYLLLCARYPFFSLCSVCILFDKIILRSTIYRENYIFTCFFRIKYDLKYIKLVNYYHEKPCILDTTNHLSRIFFKTLTIIKKFIKMFTLILYIEYTYKTRMENFILMINAVLFSEF